MGRTTTDADLLNASLDGETSAFVEIVERYQRLVCGVCFSATGNWALAEDVAQDTFIAAWGALDRLQEPSRLAAWLCGIARNLSHKAQRRRRREVPIEHEPVAEDSPLDDAIAREDARLVSRSLARLPERYREPLVLFYLEGHSAQAIGEALGVSEAAVHQRLSRGRKKLEAQVSALVESALSRHRPKKGFTAAVLAAIAAGAFVADASAATKGTTMTMTTKMSAGAIALGLVAAGWYAGGGCAERRCGAASDAPIASAPTATNAPDPAPSPSTAREAVATVPAVVLPSPPVEAPATPERYGTYALRGVEQDWADGRIGQLLDPCFEGQAPGRYTFAIDLDAAQVSGVRLVGGDALGLAEDRIEVCVRDELGAFGLKAIAGEATELDVSFAERSGPPPFDPELAAALNLEDAPSRGAADAPITMVVFVGFKCVFCGKLLGTIDQLLDEYPTSLRVVIRPFALHDTDVVITEAAYAAKAQGKFWAMHDAMLAGQDELGDATIRTFAERAGLDLERFDLDLEHHTFAELVEAERAEARAAGVVAVPTILLGEERIMGARPIEELRAKIDALIAP